MSFTDFNLHPNLLKAIADGGYSAPTEIQQNAIPTIINKSDIRASAQTGTGKTAAFLLPALNRLALKDKRPKGPQVLILVPTRELAMQIDTQAQKYGKYLKSIKTVTVVGGVPYPVQLRKLSRPYDVLIATPGRLIDLMDRKVIDFEHIEMLILDEADRMLDMGFAPSVEKIVKATPSSRQTLLFSATLRGSVIKFSDRLMDAPKEIVVHSDHAKHENISQTVHYVDDLHHKNRLLSHLLNDKEMQCAIVFTATKRHADKLVIDLKNQGHKAAALHGDMRQNQRTRTVMQLRKGQVKILVATDVAARGIDVPAVTHVINFDLPNSIEDYVHRIGRTGRAGAQGTALSFAAHCDKSLLHQIEKFTGQKIDVTQVKGFEPSAKPKKQDARPSRRPHRFNAKNNRHAPASKGRRGPGAKGRKAPPRKGRRTRAT